MESKVIHNFGKACSILVLYLLTATEISAQCTLGKCVTDLSQSDCPPSTYLQDNQTVNGCCPGCVEYEGFGEECFGNVRRCAPGLVCVGGICVVDTSSCLHFLHIDVNYQPSCLPDGTYAPVQCKGDRITGRCFCSDAQGNRIPGLSWRSQSEDMTCGCSRRRAELELEGHISTLHCTQDGSYEPLQCDDGLCWCADPKTGEADTIIVPDEMMEQLPCYVAAYVGTQYLRQCESLVVAQALIHREQAQHGTELINYLNTFCDYDGSYGYYQIENGIAYCSWSNGSRIMSYQTSAGANLRTTNCFCARDTVIYQEFGTPFPMSCAGNGNYEPKQTAGTRHYCVDRDGFPTTELADFGVDIDCPAHY